MENLHAYDGNQKIDGGTGRRGSLRLEQTGNAHGGWQLEVAELHGGVQQQVGIYTG